MTAVIVGVWSMIFLGGLMRGIATQMVRNGISTLTGHIQVHHRGYRNDPSIENSMLGAAHAAANPLTADYDIIHGQAVGVMVPHVIRYNAVQRDIAAVYRQLAIRCGLT